MANIQIIQGDIFDVPRGTYIAHGISGDFSLGAGLAKKIDERYNMRYKLFLKYPFDPGKNNGYVGKALLIDDVFNLVDKSHYKQKLDLTDLMAALEDMKAQCIDLGVKKIAMPKIGTGHDHMNWVDVLDIIEDTFADCDDMEINIYEL